MKNNLVSPFVKWIHCCPILSYRIEKPPLKELPNVDVLISRKIFLHEVVYYFDLMQENENGIRFVKISDVRLDKTRKVRGHIVVGLTELHRFINIVNEGKYKEAISDGETYRILEDSTVFEDKKYEFNVWGRGTYAKRVQIEIKETGRAYANFIKNRDPSLEYGTFRIVIGIAHLQDFVTELDALLLDVNEM